MQASSLRLGVLVCSFVAATLASSCTVWPATPGPFHACGVVLWEVWEVEGGSTFCTCDLDPPPPSLPTRQRLAGRAWGVTLVAPPGSLPPRAEIVGSVEGHPLHGVVDESGSAIVVASWEPPEPLTSRSPAPPRNAVVSVGGRDYTIDLTREPAGYVTALDDDPRFPAGAWAIEDPPGTIDVQVAVSRARATHVAIGQPAGGWSWHAPRADGIIAVTTPGHAGDILDVWTLFPDHTASCGSYARSFCHCSTEVLSRHACPYENMPWFAESITPGAALEAAWSDADAGVTDAATPLSDAGPPDAADAGAPL